ncbi:MAG: hypothetical protein LBS54_07350 [Dysgonamonadaceae bacterium]|jgi:hypothetical protein|nr:hypothetical protein [Dysgonamonadaceae bacterium]
MAKNKKRKKHTEVSMRKSINASLSKHHVDACIATAKRIMKSLGEDESKFDLFTKRQRQDIFCVTFIPPRVMAAEGHMVPRHFLKYIQEQLLIFLKREYFSQENNVTWMDMATIGITLIMVFGTEKFRKQLAPQQQEIIDQWNMKLINMSIYGNIQLEIAKYVRGSLLLLSQPNFRIYGQVRNDCKIASNKTSMFESIKIVTHESVSYKFNYRNRERKAFLIAMGQYLTDPYRGATIPIKKIYPNIKQDRNLDIYIQSHAIHRFKERLDTVHPVMKNDFFILSLMAMQQLVTGPEGTHLIACITPISSSETKTVGYFTFTIDGNKLLVLTLLPLLSRDVPEGRVLYERLKLSEEDIKYLGMDKLSFFYEVDVNRIPALKEVLYDELHLDYINQMYNSYREKGTPFDEKKTLFVKNFFQKIEEHRSILNRDVADPEEPELDE